MLQPSAAAPVPAELINPNVVAEVRAKVMCWWLFSSLLAQARAQGWGLLARCCPGGSLVKLWGSSPLLGTGTSGLSATLLGAGAAGQEQEEMVQENRS